MKTLVKLICVFVLFSSLELHAQKGKPRPARHPGRHPREVVVKRSPYRPAKVIVFHPMWRPAYTYHRRWIFWPGYNIYWDNWRNHYVFWNGSIWISQPTPPSAIQGKNMADEKHNELKESDDDTDDIYKNNDQHKKDYKDE